MTPVLLVGENGEPRLALGKLDGEHARSPVAVGNLANHGAAEAIHLFIDDVGVIDFQDQLRIRKAFAQADLDARFGGFELDAAIARALPAFATLEAQPFQKLDQRA